MQHQVSVITLGVHDQVRARRFYTEGFGWTPVFENEEIIFFQMNGFVLGLFSKPALEADMNREGLATPGAFSLAHNVTSRDEVDHVMTQLESAGGHILRQADSPAHGGYRGYIADPDDHAWEIAWNAAWPIDDQGHVTFAAN